MARRIGLVGVTGYTGMELARLVAACPDYELARATSRAEAGKTLAEHYPFLQGLALGSLPITEPDTEDLAAACELVFLAVPHCAAQELAADLLERGVKVVDLSADFRLRDAATYEAWYKVKHCRRELLPEAVYGLPEFYAQAVAGARLVANPGCYPTAAILALRPLLEAGCIGTGGIVIDAKSGATGAGRKAAVPTLFCEVADSFRAYGLAGHRHTPEIEQELAVAAGMDLTVTFSPHLVPMGRGILETIYATPLDGVDLAEVRRVYEEAYKDAPFVRLLPEGRLPETRHVRGAMFCDLAPVMDARAGRLLVVSVIDNLCRGASGQALMNANLMLGLPPDTGLRLAPAMP